MTDTINNGIPFVPENTIDPAAGLNESLLIIDRLLQLKVLGMKIDTPPGSPTAGDRYIVGATPTGAWVGKELQVAEWMPEGYWGFSPASVAVYATSVYINTGSDWVPATAGSPTSWGGITGAIADQLDLALALAAKANTADLGTAAAANKQTSISDDTAGRLMTVGGAGWLGSQPMPMPSSGAINTNLKPGLYLYGSTLGNTGGPEAFGTVLVTSSHADAASAAGWAWQSFYGTSGQRYERRSTVANPTTAGDWSDWRAIEPRPYIIAVVGDSLSTDSALHSESWPALLERNLNQSGPRRFRVMNFSVAGQTCLDAYTVNNFGSQTALNAAISVRPDALILATCSNDTLINASGATLAARKTQVQAFFNGARAALPNALLLSARMTHYDKTHGTPATLINQQVTPHFWNLPTTGIFANCRSMEFGGDAVSSSNRTKFADTEDYLDYITTLPQGVLEFDVDIYKAARIGGIGADMLHLNTLGNKMLAGYVKKGLVAVGGSAFAHFGAGSWAEWEDPDAMFSALLTSSGGQWVPVDQSAIVDHSDLMDAPTGNVDLTNWALRYKASFVFDRTTVPVTGTALLMVTSGKKGATLYGSLNGGAFASTAQLNNQGVTFSSLQASLIGTGTFTVRYKIADCIYGPLTITVT